MLCEVKNKTRIKCKLHFVFQILSFCARFTQNLFSSFLDISLPREFYNVTQIKVKVDYKTISHTKTPRYIKVKYV